MIKSKLVLDNFEVDEFHLCAIHATMPSYKMAFLLNKQLGLKFNRTDNDVEVSEKETNTFFSRYVFDDIENYTTYTLVKNKCIVKQVVTSKEADLFAEQKTQQVIKNLIPEYKNVDYFLKIETDAFDYSSKVLITKILKITQVITAFSVNYEVIKSKTNLIFE